MILATVTDTAGFFVFLGLATLILLRCMDALPTTTSRSLCDARAVMVTTRKPSKRWSQRVTEASNALDLEAGVFAKDDPRAIARSLQRSAERSRRRKSDPYRSAMSMLTFYINRAGKTLSKAQRNRLEAAKDELRGLYHRPRSK